MDNFIIAYEISHYFKRKRHGRVGTMTLKVDMSKAYDKVEWLFVESMMKKMGLDSKWIRIMMLCIASVRYIKIGDFQLDNPLVPGRGLRQGDPLSPYLFLICAEGVSSRLNGLEAAGKIYGCAVSRLALRINHLFFADDCYLFFRAVKEEATIIRNTLLEYGSVSGQVVKFNKCNIRYSFNTDHRMRAKINNLMCINKVDNQGLYLGLPSLIGRNKRDVFRFIKDRVWQKLQGWRSKMLSSGGNEILLKSAAQAMPNHVMSVFLIHVDLCAELQRMMNSYWWSRDSSSKKGTSWSSLNNLCTPKGLGGMGFKNLHEFNVAMLGRQSWRLLQNKESLCFKVLSTKYFPSGNFFDATLGNNPSFTWRSIFATQELMRSGVRRGIGPGSQTRVWYDPWLANGNNRFIEKTALEGLSNTTRRGEDYWTRVHEKRGNYSVKTGYWALYGEVTGLVHETPPRPVGSKVFNLRHESVEHVLYHCHVARGCWRRLGVQVPGDDNTNAHEWLLQTFNCKSVDERNVKAMVCWKIWLHRNEVVWNDNWGSPELIVNSVASDLVAWQCAQKKICQQLSSSLGKNDGLIILRALPRGDNDGRLIQARVVSYQGSSTARIAELIAIKEALSWLRGNQNVIFDSDALDVIMDLWLPLKAGIDPIIDECNSLSKQFSNCRFIFVRRSANGDAHLLAQASRSMPGQQEWFHIFPAFLTPVIASVIA
ncbi:uncharacterized protein LOC126675366 [Mercurialis annua]|uniref:uncharacterized protein LOC126675366 n=1 Tax=Mercurialis annua TaxID=3986 RepID=UPI00215EA8A5|nr:uncharacterized protein LOC126675366 [Mercurialis annua]